MTFVIIACIIIVIAIQAIIFHSIIHPKEEENIEVQWHLKHPYI